MPPAGAKKYQALMNLSVPRTGLAAATGANDLVMRGEDVTLTEEQARGFLNQNPPRIRPWSEKDQPLPFIRPRDLTGRMFGPPEGARPDPAGSTRIQITEQESRIPEMTPPVMAGTDAEPQVDALDILPGTARVTAGV